MRTISISAALLAGLFTGSFAHAATDAPTYVAKAGAGDLYEIQSSKLVLTTTADAKVKAFANKMIADHAASTAKVNVAAEKSGLKVTPPKLDASQEAMIATLSSAKGPARDSAYLNQQHKAHAQALTLHQEYAQSGDKPALKAAAAEIVPVVKQHIATMPTSH